jgi:hypothetical protein
VTDGRPESYLAECYWPGVSDDALAETVARADAAALELRRQGRNVDLRGTILVRSDETVFCLFEGHEADVRAAGELAGVTFERVLESLWLDPGDPGS